MISSPGVHQNGVMKAAFSLKAATSYYNDLQRVKTLLS